MKSMQTKLSITKTLTLALLGFALVAGTINIAPKALASGGNNGGGGGGGSVQAPAFSGNWSGTVSTSFGTGAFTMRISQSGAGLSGSVHFGAPIFDATLKLTAVSNGSQFGGFVSSGEGSLPITGTLSADGTMIAGTVIQLGQTYTFVVTRI